MPIGRPVETIFRVSSLFPQDESSGANFEGIPPDVGRTGGIVGMGSIRAVSDLAVGFALPRSPPAPLTMPGPMALACNCPPPRWIENLRDLVDLVGIEPTTSSMPFLNLEWGYARRAEHA